jgi:hypothetical protein
LDKAEESISEPGESQNYPESKNQWYRKQTTIENKAKN